ncbi:hypothetical protein F4818DRAFT_384065 [Hypoxylon cercidicola]|nr:hypothetical protein F4818DRAFT_384065 [Hypoxylon cercidicola]
MPRPRLALKRCERCKRDRQKCSFAPTSQACERCLDRGYNCPGPTKGTTLGVAVKKERNRFKCDGCRNLGLKCNPRGRVWPDKCEYCEARGLPCSTPRTKMQAEKAHLATDKGVINGKSNADDEPQQTIHVAPDHFASALSPVCSQPVSPGPEPDHSDSDTSTPPVPQTTGRKASNGDDEPDELEQLRNVVHRMEDEFEEVLRAEQLKYEREIRALEYKHREELNQQRERYETRVDILISIIKNL